MVGSPRRVETGAKARAAAAISGAAKTALITASMSAPGAHQAAPFGLYPAYRNRRDGQFSVHGAADPVSPQPPAAWSTEAKKLPNAT